MTSGKAQIREQVAELHKGDTWGASRRERCCTRSSLRSGNPTHNS